MPTQHCECGAKYRFPDSAVGKRAKCKKCGAVLVLRDEEDDGTLRLSPSDSSASVEHGRSPGTPTVQGEIVRPPESFDPRQSVRATVSAAGPLTAKRGYWSDVLWTFLFPANPSNLIAFLIIWAFMACALAIVPFVAWMPYLGLLARWVIAGWFAAFQFEVLGAAAAGEDDLPQPTVESGIVPVLLIALLKWIGSWILVMAPAIAYLMSLLSQGAITGMDVLGMLANGVPGMLQSSGGLIVFELLACAGVFFWPIVALCIALDSFSVLYRVDLVVLTIIKTFPMYLLTLALMFGAVAAEYAVNEFIDTRTSPGQGAGARGVFGAGLVLHVAGTGIHVYMSIVVMRLIGLYYVYGKKRFAWSWE